MSNSTFQNYVANGAGGLPPITAALCETWDANQQAVQMYRPIGPPQIGVSAPTDAVHSLEQSVIAIQGG